MEIMKFELDQPYIEVHSGEGVEVGDYLGLITYFSDGKKGKMWTHWVKVFEVAEAYLVVQFMQKGSAKFSTVRDRTYSSNKWVKMITNRDYKIDQEPMEDEEVI